jgi:hypothetical protein
MAAGSASKASGPESTEREAFLPIYTGNPYPDLHYERGGRIPSHDAQVHQEPHHIPTDDSVKKAVFLSVKEISKKWTMPLRNWGLIYGQLMIHFGQRLPYAS